MEELNRLQEIEKRLRKELEEEKNLLEEEKKPLPAGTSGGQERAQQFRIDQREDQIAFIEKMLGEE